MLMMVVRLAGPSRSVIDRLSNVKSIVSPADRFRATSWNVPDPARTHGEESSTVSHEPGSDWVPISHRLCEIRVVPALGVSSSTLHMNRNGSLATREVPAITSNELPSTFDLRPYNESTPGVEPSAAPVQN